MEEITIIKSEYVTSAVSKATCPEELLPEIVFVGRSNVGKLSLINFFRVELKTADGTCYEYFWRR